ncbi:hypothetical protein BV898_00574 [Hypsibius exemplaris]|uniref:Uncharacterized protein n=1 Tax=Hypsibius exemplaris TaxID=2072580 RepID=A0A1W0XDU1_HYPEX|nr:hypothetical protein BV898_00574 [Hypsibius exemplaris]
MSRSTVVICAGGVARSCIIPPLAILLLLIHGPAHPLTGMTMTATAFEVAGALVAGCLVRERVRRMATYLAMTGVAWLVVMATLIYGVVYMLGTTEKEEGRAEIATKAILLLLGLTYFPFQAFCFYVGLKALMELRGPAAAAHGGAHHTVDLKMNVPVLTGADEGAPPVVGTTTV